MKPEVMLELLESAAEQLQIKVSYESLAASVGHGGLCRVKGSYRVIVDKRATTQERITTLASAIASFDVSDLELPEKVRELIRFHEGSARIKLPSAATVAVGAVAAGAVVGTGSEAGSGRVRAPAGTVIDPVTGKIVAA